MHFSYSPSPSKMNRRSRQRASFDKERMCFYCAEPFSFEHPSGKTECCHTTVNVDCHEQQLLEKRRCGFCSKKTRVPKEPEYEEPDPDSYIYHFEDRIRMEQKRAAANREQSQQVEGSASAEDTSQDFTEPVTRPASKYSLQSLSLGVYDDDLDLISFTSKETTANHDLGQSDKEAAEKPLSIQSLPSESASKSSPPQRSKPFNAAFKELDNLEELRRLLRFNPDDKTKTSPLDKTGSTVPKDLKGESVSREVSSSSNHTSEQPLSQLDDSKENVRPFSPPASQPTSKEQKSSEPLPQTSAKVTKSKAPALTIPLPTFDKPEPSPTVNTSPLRSPSNPPSIPPKPSKPVDYSEYERHWEALGIHELADAARQVERAAPENVKAAIDVFIDVWHANKDRLSKSERADFYADLRRRMR